MFERPKIIAVLWYEIVWLCRKILLIEIMEFLHNDLTLCSVDWFIEFNCLPTNKTSPQDPLKEMKGRNISCNNGLVCYLHLLASCWSDRIRYQLMWKIAVSNRLMDLQNYQRSRKSKRNNNQKHWTANHVLPFQRWQVAPWCAFLMDRCYLFNDTFFVPKVLIEKPAHTDP